MKARMCVRWGVLLGCSVCLQDLVGTAETAQTAAVQTPERVFLVKVSDFGGNASYDLKSADEIKALEKEIEQETRNFAKAMMLAEQAWEQDEKTARKPFPKSAIERRKFSVLGEYDDREKAEAKLTALRERDKERALDDAKKEQERAKLYGAKTVDSKKDDDKAKEKEHLLIQARQMFEDKLAELRTGQAAAKSPAAPAPVKPQP